MAQCIYGIRWNGEDKFMGIRSDSDPDHLGRQVVRDCMDWDLDDWEEIFSNLRLKEGNDGTLNYSDCHPFENALDNVVAIKNCKCIIKCSTVCDYAYIVNLDDEVLDRYDLVPSSGSLSFAFAKHPQINVHNKNSIPFKNKLVFFFIFHLTIIAYFFQNLARIPFPCC